MRITHGWQDIFALCALLVLAGCGDSPDNGEREHTRAIMQEIFAGLRVALPASADVATFGDPAKRETITAALGLLTRNASTLERHARSKDAQLGFLARSIASDAREIERAYTAGRYARSAYLLQQTVEHCIACHTRLPVLADSEVTAEFVEDGVFQDMPAEARSSLLIATRRFDAALALLEQELVDPMHHIATLLGPLTDYLVVSIRVKGDYARPRPVLARIAAREDAWSQLKLDIEGWLAALPELERLAVREPSVATARALVEEGDRLDAFPGDMSSRLHLIAASAVLERLIDAHDENDAALGEAYYLLGVVEASIGRNYWVTPAPFLLAESVRIAPHAPTAAQAYALLERELLQSYEGSEHEELPPEDREHLDSLQQLMQGS
ncbi:MAG: hypothetical protein JRH16_05770 [Deltaproteobacteria bacterium]|nr:hypothetical protein [Deltaproteobacteria bacterium]MBW2361360.1 hypothetical protein [Deltaproteobacteria bacterium]